VEYSAPASLPPSQESAAIVIPPLDLLAPVSPLPAQVSDAALALALTAAPETPGTPVPYSAPASPLPLQGAGGKKAACGWPEDLYLKLPSGAKVSPAGKVECVYIYIYMWGGVGQCQTIVFTSRSGLLLAGPEIRA
jgi:hypothetical protein